MNRFTNLVLSIACVLLCALPCMSQDVPVTGDEVVLPRAQPSTYIGIAEVTAVPTDNGYQITYRSNGAVSHISKEDFERTFFSLPTGEITEEAVNRFIVGTESKAIGNRTTATATKTQIGFDVVETATAAETYGFDNEVATEISDARARAMVWTFLGFAKQWADNGLNQ